MRIEITEDESMILFLVSFIIIIFAFFIIIGMVK